MKSWRTLLLVLPLLWLFAACTEEGFVLPAEFQTPLAASFGDDEIDDGIEYIEAVADLSSFLYSGPGRFYEEAGSVFPGQRLRLTGRDETGNWYRLADNTWINALAVQGRPQLPVATQVEGRAIAQVIEVLDGDTISVRFNDRTYEVRYLISVAPQVEQGFGREAYEWNLAAVDGRTVLLEADITEVDAYGRLLRYVYLAEDRSMVNEALLRAGYAQVAIFPPDVKYEDVLRRAQAEAEVERRGLWAADVVPYREDFTACTYTVQPGESLSLIARRFGLGPASLAEANGIEDPNLLRHGVQLTLPGCGRAAAEPQVEPTPEAESTPEAEPEAEPELEETPSPEVTTG
ncbi:MAG: thermonuclease family protein [Caldilineaceae bacterium]|nr:thermonuclease family protein [Caldilineaceae bacterium]